MKPEALGPASAKAVSALHQRCFDHGWSEAEFTALLHLSSSHLHAVREKNTLIGFILCRSALDEAELLTICTHPDKRGKGIGRRLLDHAHAHLAAEGIGRIFLEVSVMNRQARRLYDRAGYSEIARRKAYYRDGSDACVMEKTLL